jgi:hypothetical protein
LKFAPVLLAVVMTACASVPSSPTKTVSQPGHGALSIQVVPNPIVARQVSGETYEFPFDVVVRETGGHPVNITRVSADVRAIAGIRVASESYDAAKIASLGYPTQLPANGELRYHFAPQKSVPDERLFGGVVADLTVEGTDDTGAATTGRTSVTVTK